MKIKDEKIINVENGVWEENIYGEKKEFLLWMNGYENFCWV